MNTIVVVASGAQVRFFNLQHADDPAYESGPRLVEQECLINPQQEATDRELWSDNTHGYDDHRDQHRAEYCRRFLQQAAETLKRLAATNKVTRVVVAAEARVLGILRQILQDKHDFNLLEVGKDYSKFNAQQLQAHLASLGLIAPCRKPGTI